ncbi:hypothetical protein [Amycolatopsis sp. NPDC052450]|uniref:hypothetical protein n=1 Tax=Amycolatopsis sp. NPDC052450 TaxID=3363937 RepID=UPI0037CAE6CB
MSEVTARAEPAELVPDRVPRHRSLCLSVNPHPRSTSAGRSLVIVVKLISSGALPPR